MSADRSDSGREAGVAPVRDLPTGGSEIAWLRTRRGRLVRGLELIDRRLAELVPEAEAPVRARPEREATWQEFECADRQTTSLLEELQAARGSGFRARRRLRRAKREAEGRLYVALRSLEDTR